ncbi:MAG: UvrD-helicase domain-containing protein [Alphaproteobacteria bacterium]|nr:UvrD-helicase domain-containing protein [Alphaproteobacteria bacterium]NCQ88506.1 UvrD-helicase domain-containing protein [Alphaproteobacteria bacterium]NCT06049.1 UvrD-helicase domain-containing protein [Alphaproteobacteria bacterium]
MEDFDSLISLSESPHSDPSVPVANATYLEGLNAPQRIAVETIDGPVLVLAGAGTGKTRVLTTRLAHILQSGRAMPGQILSVTFTNKAAQEMRRRVSSILGGQHVEGWWLGTFHALAARMLRVHADRVGLSSNFTILDSDDQVRLVKQLMDLQGIDQKKNPPKVVATKISSWKDKGLNPPDITGNDLGDEADRLALSLYRPYQERLIALNACDFGDLLLHMITIFKDPAHGDVLEDYHRRFKYIMVDEYQDTNVAQYLWLRLLAKKLNNICCVGDDDQSIYGWRGAEVDNILRFDQDFPGATIVRLEENYRSTEHILAAANGVISHNDNRLGKELFTSANSGDKIIVRGLWDGGAEARWACEEMEALQSKGWRASQMAVLVRTSFQMREFEERFIQLGLPYRVIGGPRFYERMEIRDALAYLRVVVQSSDDLALERIINKPKRGLGDSTLQTLYTHARVKQISLYVAIQDLCQTEELKPKVRGTLMRLIDDFERWKSLASSMAQSELAGLILDESGYLGMWQTDKAPDSPGRVENLKELTSSMEEFEGLQTFLEHIALVLDNQDSNNQESITLMTLHGAKGLEFDCVFLPGWEDGLFPSQRSMDENGLKGLEEERRLAYVGITRARKKAFISFVGNRRMHGSWVNAIPSRFVDELPKAHIEANSEMGMYSAGGNQGRSSHWDSSGIGVQSRLVVEVERKTISGFSMGTRVFHEKFGYGKIIHIDGQKLDVAFEKSGQKRVMDSFVRQA